MVGSKAVIIPAQFQDAPEEDLSRVLFFFDDEWFYRDFDNANVRSVTCRDGLCYLMGMNGVVHSVGRSGRTLSPETIAGSYRESVISDTDYYGSLFRIRFVGEDVYTCGQSSQVHILRGNKWQHYDDGILRRGGPTLEDIDGTGPEISMQSAGKGPSAGSTVSVGEIRQPNEPTFLECPLRLRDEIYVCGNKGSLYRGDGKCWEFIGDPDFTENFWGMAVFEGQIYLAHNLGLMKFEDSELVPIEPGIGRKLTCHRLHGADGVMWSFGERELLRFDGKAWAEVVCPENG